MNRKFLFFVLFLFIGLLSIASFYNFDHHFFKNRIKHYQSLLEAYQATPSPVRKAPNYSEGINPFFNKDFIPPDPLRKVYAASTADLRKEINLANKNGGNIEIILSDGEYLIDKTLYISADNISISSYSSEPERVAISGGREIYGNIGNIFRVTGKNFRLDGITLKNSRYHLIQIAGENDADYPVIRNCILEDSYQQLLKVSYDINTPETSSDFGLVENCIFRYSEGIAPNFYTGGIDIHAGNNWLIRNNTFKDIASPGYHIAEHAVHVWNNAANTVVDSNLFEDNDRAIGFGLLASRDHPAIVYSHWKGIIQNNTIIHSDNGDPFADAGIVLEYSPETIVQNNEIWMAHDYPNAIEYRFTETRDVLIRDNITNKSITSKNGGHARLLNNETEVQYFNMK